MVDQPEINNAINVIVVDDDQDICRSIQKIFKDMGQYNIEIFSDGESAWNRIEQQKFDLFVIDWNLPKISGPALVNRCRSSERHEFTPIMIVSGFLKKKDFSFLEDIPFSALLEKPFNSNLLKFKSLDLLKESKWFISQKPLIADLSKSFVEKKDPADFIEFLSTAPKPVPLGIAAVRETARLGFLSSSEKILDFLIEKSPNSVTVLTELGKIYLKTNRQDLAVKTLGKAQHLAPKNAERLCLLGNVHLQNLKIGEAKELFSKALAIDPLLKKANAGMTLTKNTEAYLSHSNVTTIPDSFASLQNAIGVSIIREKKYKIGINHYEAALALVSEHQTLAKLAFNLGLGYIKWQKPKEAFDWFKKSVDFSQGKFEKSAQYLEKIVDLYGGKIPGVPKRLEADNQAVQSEPKNNPATYFQDESFAELDDVFIDLDELNISATASNPEMEDEIIGPALVNSKKVG